MKVRWSLVLPVAGTVLLAGGIIVGLLAPRHTGTALVMGVFGIIGITVALGAPLRRSGSPHGPHWRLIGYGVGGMVAASAIFNLPPHSALAAGLILILSVGSWCIGVGILGGGLYGIAAAVAAGLLGSALLMAPTPLALASVGVPLHCKIPNSDGHVYDFTAVCPGGHRYTFPSQHSHDFPGARVTVLVDPHGILAPEYAGEHHPAEDLPVAIGSVLVAAGVVVAAAVNRNRRHGEVARVVKPPITT